MILRGALQLLDAIVGGAVEEQARNDPPASPAFGSCYIVGQNPTGEWSAYPGQLAAFGEAGWRFVAPTAGLSVLVKSTATTASYIAGEWDLGSIRGDRVVVGGRQVLGPQAAAIAGPAGGATVDSEVRAVVDQILATLRLHGLIAE